MSIPVLCAGNAACPIALQTALNQIGT